MLAWASFCLGQMSAQIAKNPSVSSEEIEPLRWPEAGRASISLSVQTRFEDGYEERVILFKCPDGVTIEAERHGSWGKTKRHTRYSIQLEETDVPDLKFGISIFAKDEFLTSLDRKEWDRYLHHLNTAFPYQQVVFEQSNLEKSGGPFVFGKHFRQVAYQWKTPAGELKKTREIFVFLRGRLYVFSFRGKPESVDATWRRQNLMLNRMNLI